VKAVIACGQFASVPGDIAGNRGRMERSASIAARQGAILIVLPELCLCGYPSPGEAREWAVTRDGPEMASIAQCARSLGIGLCFGFAERDPSGTLRNSMAFMDKDGRLISVYRKVHLWVTEREWAVPGEEFACFSDGPLALGMWICYDTRFPEAARSLARGGALIGLAGSAWFGPAEEWELALRARALDNGIYVAGAAAQGAFRGAAARPGTEAHAARPVAFHGGSLIVDPHGRVLARGREGEEAVICAEYDSAVADAFRARLPLLGDLRPEAYA
jgi:predicted amidohydrolase